MEIKKMVNHADFHGAADEYFCYDFRAADGLELPAKPPEIRHQI